ncbi:MAG TPA: carboxypeptidase-like regulatory domain-containing protein [Hymenobacter sp.]|uniref:carboxypeptidase-like regulatory domain-containing protein n=1 Tax=Hymenobacter sp. TaxID=1898978 RepID=UPI002D7F9E17|nr:carboxypeptidase-like regulatory domain-containing protein [Hymenobacter sp.]HET9506189.1 carboxypeptidase-like regulatory domain-containing protein [Hymenobacter sp.]
MKVFEYLLPARNQRASGRWRWQVAAQLLLLGVLLASARPAHAQAGQPAPQLRVSGTVSDARTGQPLPGAAVRRLHTPRGVVANAEGDFLIPAYATDTLLFQALGYKPQRLPLRGTTLAQLVVQVRLLRDSVRLGEVRVTADRADRSSIDRALRNMKRPAPPVVHGARRPPAPKPLFAVDSTPPALPKPTIASPTSWAYEKLSRAGKERRKVQQLQAQDAKAKAYKKQLEYNKAFKDNRGYE